MVLTKSIAAFVLLTGIAVQGDTYSFRHKPKEGETQTHKMAIDMELMGQQMKISLRMRTKTTKVEEDGGYTQESTMLGGSMDFGGNSQDMPAEDPKLIKFDKDGKVIKDAAADAAEDENDPTKMLGDMYNGMPKNPVKVGESWESKNDMMTVKATLAEIVDVDGVSCLKVNTTGKVTKQGLSGDITGTVYYDKATFLMNSVDFKITNAKFTEDMPEANMTMKVTLEK